MPSHTGLRRLMRHEHQFLYKLFCEKKGRINRASIQHATPNQVWIVLRLLFCIAVGHIPITYKNYQKLVRSKRKNSLRSLKNRMQFLRKRHQIEARRRFLYQFSSLFPYLFHDIFVESKVKKNVNQ